MRIAINYTNIGPIDVGGISTATLRIDGVGSGTLALTPEERPVFEAILKRGCGKAHTLVITGEGAIDPQSPQPGLFDNAPPD